MTVSLDAHGHLAADTLPELHAFARRIGLKREWVHHRGELSHYDLTTERARQRAIAAGAVVVSPREMPAIARRMNRAEDGRDCR